MFTTTFDDPDSLQTLETVVVGLLDFAADLPGLGDIIADEVRQGNTDGLLAGLDKDGTAMPVTQRQLDADLSARFGAGEPLNPNSSASRSIADFTVVAETVGDLSILVTGTWPNTPFIQYHRGPFKGRPARDIVGIRPETMGNIMARVDEWIEARLGRGII